MNSYTKLAALVMPIMAIPDIQLMNELANEMLTKKTTKKSHKNGSRLNYAGIKKFKEKGVIKP